MRFSEQFDRFDPLSGNAPIYPASTLSSYLARARHILQGATAAHITELAETADYFIDTFHEVVREELGEESKHIYTDFEALKQGIEWYDLAAESDFPSSGQTDYFAAFALWHLANAVNCITGHSPTDGSESDSEKSLALMNIADCISSAAEAIHFAEKELGVEPITSIQRAAILSEVGRKAANTKHAPHRAMKEKVFSWCRENLDRYSSMDKAATEIAGNLVHVTFRTARKWITEYNRDIRSTRRE